MPPTLFEARRAELLTGVIGYIAEYGLAGLSLRPLAAELGTSARMLVHYFGSKEQMLIAALAAQRPDIENAFADVCDPETLRHRLLESWSANTSGPGATSTTVLLQVLGQACVPDGPFSGYARAAVDVLVEALTQVLHRIDPAVPDAEASATLLISGIRGLVLDRRITGDTARTDTAAGQLIDQVIHRYR
ncbi:TetR/AcrR family transcriptional regulator [Nocardia sp. NPDC051990]|uniref:TetR/AcrR family transcriptional regulator n=1 Tax=Nocardia sp. NPDC051990 TaxID=3155285 RepID=UPI00341B2C54